MLKVRDCEHANNPARDKRHNPTRRPAVDDLAQEKIASGLRAMYDDLVQQPLPDRFAQLLAQLDQQRLGGP